MLEILLNSRDENVVNNSPTSACPSQARWHCEDDGNPESSWRTPEVLNMVKPMVDTCKVCRQWVRPSPKAIATHRLSTAFNQTV